MKQFSPHLPVKAHIYSYKLCINIQFSPSMRKGKGKVFAYHPHHTIEQVKTGGSKENTLIPPHFPHLFAKTTCVMRVDQSLLSAFTWLVTAVFNNYPIASHCWQLEASDSESSIAEYYTLCILCSERTRLTWRPTMNFNIETLS